MIRHMRCLSKMFNNKKGYIHHPVMMIIGAFIVGMIVMYLIGKGIIPIKGIAFCPKP